MVRSKPEASYGRYRGSWIYKDYWKLERKRRFGTVGEKLDLEHRLQDDGFYFKKSANRRRLHELISRSERGLLSYEGCKTTELKAFYTQRRLAFDNNEKKAGLVRGLESADEF